MKQVINKEDKAVSPIIATILLIAITVVLAATLVTILGGFTHGVSNTVVTVGATTSEVDTSSGYIVYLNVSSSSTNLTASSVTLEINGGSNGTLATPIGNGMTAKSTDSAYINGGSHFVIESTNELITSVDLVYKGNTIYQSGTISVTS